MNNNLPALLVGWTRKAEPRSLGKGRPYDPWTFSKSYRWCPYQRGRRSGARGGGIAALNCLSVCRSCGVVGEVRLALSANSHGDEAYGSTALNPWHGPDGSGDNSVILQVRVPRVQLGGRKTGTPRGRRGRSARVTPLFDCSKFPIKKLFLVRSGKSAAVLRIEA